MSTLAEELLSEISDDCYGYLEYKSEEAKTKVIECIDKYFDLVVVNKLEDCRVCY